MGWPKGKPRGFKTPGSGRKAGQANRTTTLLKDQILDALDQAGGTKYLVWLAQENPQAFSTLIGKVLPTQITGADNGPLVVTWANPNDSQ
jgi:hypothetical protein